MIKKKGDEINVEVIDLNSEGKGITKLEDGFVIFTENALPGDYALIKIKKKKSNYAEAKLIEIIKQSPFRVTPKCKYFGVCGGCKIQNYDYEKQIVYKTNVVKSAFDKIGDFKSLDVPAALKSDEIFYYRNKMEFSFSDDLWYESIDLENHEEKKGGFALGLHVPRFHSKIININECFLQSKLSNEILNFTRELFKSKCVSVYSTKTQSGFLRFLIIRQSKYTNDLMINLITFDYNKDLMIEYSEQLKRNFPYITTITNSTSQKKAQVALGENEYVLHGKGYITEKLNTIKGKEYIFNISPQSFFQTNTLQAEKVFNLILKLGELDKDDTVLDLYCGIGSISIFISDIVNEITGVEMFEDSILKARENAKLNNVGNAEFIISDVKDFLEHENNLSKYNKLILDPPRSGLHPKICDILSETKFEKILYISCNPHSQARDLKIICGKMNYKIENIQPVDMFPHTYHIENIVSLKKFE